MFKDSSDSVAVIDVDYSAYFIDIFKSEFRGFLVIGIEFFQVSLGLELFELGKHIGGVRIVAHWRDLEVR